MGVATGVVTGVATGLAKGVAMGVVAGVVTGVAMGVATHVSPFQSSVKIGHVGGSGRKFACTLYIHDAMPPSIFGPVGPP